MWMFHDVSVFNAKLIMRIISNYRFWPLQRFAFTLIEKGHEVQCTVTTLFLCRDEPNAPKACQGASASNIS